MKRKKQSAMSLVLSLLLAFTMCFAGAGSVFAAEEEAESENFDSIAVEKVVKAKAGTALAEGGTITAQNINKISSAKFYSTPTVDESSSYSQSYSYNVKMPAKGTLAISYYTTDSAGGYLSVKNSAGNSLTTTGSETTDNGVTIRYYYFSKAGTAKIEASVIRPNGGASKNAMLIAANYAPTNTPIIAANNKVVMLGSPGSTTTTTKFKVKVKTNGYLTLDLGDATSIGTSGYSVQAKTKGYSDYDYFTSTDAEKWIGVKKGTYTFTVKTYSPIYGVKVKFTKVKQTGGLKKSKATTLKKKKAVTGTIVTDKKNAQNVHWYKFKNPKNQKVKLVFNTKGSAGGKYYFAKVTVYDSKGYSITQSIPSGNGTVSVQPYTISNNNKLRKGTYYVKVQRYQSGTGYYKLTWK